MKRIILSSLLFIFVVAMLLVGCGKTNDSKQGNANDGKDNMTVTIPDVQDVKDIPWGEYEDGSAFDPFADSADNAIVNGAEELIDNSIDEITEDIQENIPEEVEIEEME